MRVLAACTLEGWTTPPRTTRTTLDVASAGKAVSQAVKAARREHPGVRWRSLVVVLEKVDAPDEAEPVEES